MCISRRLNIAPPTLSPPGFPPHTQVYYAKVRATGQEVAVKVQRPGALSTISKDLYVMRRGVGVYEQLVKRFTAQTTDYQQLLSTFAEGLYTGEVVCGRVCYVTCGGLGSATIGHQCIKVSWHAGTARCCLHGSMHARTERRKPPNGCRLSKYNPVFCCPPPPRLQGPFSRVAAAVSSAIAPCPAAAVLVVPCVVLLQRWTSGMR